VNNINILYTDNMKRFVTLVCIVIKCLKLKMVQLAQLLVGAVTSCAHHPHAHVGSHDPPGQHHH